MFHSQLKVMIRMYFRLSFMLAEIMLILYHSIKSEGLASSTTRGKEVHHVHVHEFIILRSKDDYPNEDMDSQICCYLPSYLD
uniref:Uncharacterized protein n=1 Tax=Oryza meridionalis TaxID=40149 RepID=A0A0E0CVR8_9ORYZ